MNYQWRDFVGSVVDGKYPLVEFLGDVAGDGVYATDAVGGRPAIIRLMPGGTDDANRSYERWQAATSLSHPHVAKTFAAGETEVIGNTVVFTVTERPDDSLAEAVRARPLSKDEGRTLADSVLSALAYLHKKGFAHGAVAPENVVAMGDTIKLAPWTIAMASAKAKTQDIFEAGQTIAEVLTQIRPTGEATMPRNLPEPFSDVARACLRKTVEADEALRILNAPPDATPVVKKKYKLPTMAIVAASLVVLALVYAVRSYTADVPAPAAETTAAPLPSPVNEDAVRGRAVSPPVAVPAAATPVRSTSGDWVVVAEIYKQHDQAVAYAQKVAERWKGWNPQVYPPTAGGRRYMVLLGSADTRKEAEQLLARARADGLPQKSYLTRLRR